MKITAPERVAPDDSHLLDPSLFGDDDRFELSTIRPEDASIAMEMLIGNYASPMDAVIRELYVNADDSHRAAGQTRPVEITMPTEENPFLTVRDFGLGMSPTDMVGVFTRPAASTKREENVSAGGLGIGAKAPFTVADRFVVRGVKDGVAATLVMARIDGHLMHLVSEGTATDAPNGVEITVPVEVTKIYKWWRALSRVHFWWDAERALITDTFDAPVELPSWHDRILDGAQLPQAPAVVHSRTLRSATVLMGQIGYSIPKNVLPIDLPLLYVMPVGSMDIAPNRESIVDSDRNRMLIEELTRTWQEEQFDDHAAEIMDPSTSVIRLQRITDALNRGGLMDHFQAWSRTLFKEMHSGDFPGQIIVRQMVNSLVARQVPPVKVWLHGVPRETSARLRPLDDLLRMMSLLDTPPLVFVDQAALSESKRKTLTAWARKEGVIAVVTIRADLEAMRFSRRWTYDEPSFTRPFANPGEIEWADPADIQVERAPRKDPLPGPTLASSISVVGLSSHTRRRDETTVEQLVSHTMKRPNRWVIVDSMSEIDKIDSLLPTNFVAVPSGQRPASLLRSELGTRALKVDQFLPNIGHFVERAMTKAQKRTLADTLLARLDGVYHLFHAYVKWIDETEGVEVRAVATEISKIVGRMVREYQDHGPNQTVAQEVMRWTKPLRRQVNDPNWLVKHASLGKFAPALIAARTNGLLPHSWSDRESAIEHIRNTIATQLVKS